MTDIRYFTDLGADFDRLLDEAAREADRRSKEAPQRVNRRGSPRRRFRLRSGIGLGALAAACALLGAITFVHSQTTTPAQHSTLGGIGPFPGNVHIAFAKSGSLAQARAVLGGSLPLPNSDGAEPASIARILITKPGHGVRQVEVDYSSGTYALLSPARSHTPNFSSVLGKKYQATINGKPALVIPAKGSDPGSVQIQRRGTSITIYRPSADATTLRELAASVR